MKTQKWFTQGLRLFAALLMGVAFVGVALSVLPVLAQVETDTDARVIAWQLRVRNLPSLTSGDIIDRVAFNETYPILGRVEDYTWYQIETANAVGWVAGQYLEIANPELVPVIPVIPEGSRLRPGMGSPATAPIPGFTSTGCGNTGCFAELGGTLTLSWAFQEAPRAIIEVYDTGSDTAVPDLIYENLPSAGSVQVTIPDSFSGDVRFILYLSQVDQPLAPDYAYRANPSNTLLHTILANATATPEPEAPAVTLTCGGSFFFENTDASLCPASDAESVDAAYQPYESGFMIWLSSTGTVYVFPDDAAPLVVTSEDYQDLPDPDDETPPDGLVLPGGAFGKVWANTDGVRAALGWALGSESGYVAGFQTGLDGDDDTAVTFLTRQDGGVFGLNVDQGIWFKAG